MSVTGAALATTAESAAYHEAAHAVVGYLLYRPVESLSITSDHDCRGCVVSRSLPTTVNLGVSEQHARAILHDSAVVALAGSVGQEIYENGTEVDGCVHVRLRAPEVPDDDHLSPDDMIVLDVLLRAGQAPVEGDGVIDLSRAFIAVFEEALDLLIPHWHLVRAVARLLLEKHALTGGELWSVVEMTPPPRVPELMVWR